MEHKAQDYVLNQSTEGNATYTATKALTETVFCLENPNAAKTFPLALMENYRKYDNLMVSLIKIRRFCRKKFWVGTRQPSYLRILQMPPHTLERGSLEQGGPVKMMCY